MKSPQPRKKAQSKEIDPSQPLPNPQQEAYVLQLRIPGTKPVDAYIAAGYKYNRKASGAKACQLTRMPQIKARLAYLIGEDQKRMHDKGVAERDELAATYTTIIRTNIADFLSVDQDGEMFIQVTKESLASPALKKCKVRRITDEHGNQVMGIHLTDIELVDKVQAGSALARLMGYEPQKNVPVDFGDSTKQFLERVMDKGLTLDD